MATKALGTEETLSIDGESVNTDSGIGSASTSILERQLVSSEEGSSSIDAVATSTPLSHRNPGRLSEVIHEPGSNAKNNLDKKTHPCHFCGKVFDRPSLLIRHIRTHTGEKPWTCPYCKKGFATKNGMIIHERTHTGVKPYKCPYCARTFNACSNYSFHIDTHRGRRRHHCEQCGKNFVTPGDLKRHMFTHTGNWPYFCCQCHKGFATVRSLQSHEHVHNKIKPFACKFCTRTYTTESSLKTHIKRHQEGFDRTMREEELAPSQLSVIETNAVDNLSVSSIQPQSTTPLNPPREEFKLSLDQSQRNIQTPYLPPRPLPEDYPSTPSEQYEIKPSLPITTSFMTPPTHTGQMYHNQNTSMKYSQSSHPGWSNQPSLMSYRPPRETDSQIQRLQSQFEGLGLRMSDRSAFVVVGKHSLQCSNHFPKMSTRRTTSSKMDPTRPSYSHQQYYSPPSQQPRRPQPLIPSQPLQPFHDEFPLDLTTKGPRGLNI
nr:zinc finger protein [Hymenolepis microstoma]